MTEKNKQETSVAIDETNTTINSASSGLADQPKQKEKKQKDITNTQPSKITLLLIIISLSLSAIALAASSWLYYQSLQNSSTQDIKELKSQQSDLDNRINKNTLDQAQLNNAITQIKATEESIQTEKQAFLKKQTQQDETLLSLEAKFERINNTTKEDWKLAEAEYLIRLANQHLLLESDSNGATALLKNADDILHELKDPIVFPARKALAKDIQALSAISSFDLEGAYLKLNALYESIPQLPQREPSKKWLTSTTLENSNDDSAVNNITSTLQSFWQSIRSLIVINYDHKPIKALLPPAEYQELITGLQLQLDIAQVTLVKGEYFIYQQALSRVANNVTEHFETESNKVISFLASLTSMQQLNPSPDLPLPRDSLIEMKALMANWNNRISSNLDEPTVESSTLSTNIEKSAPSNNLEQVNTGESL